MGPGGTDHARALTAAGEDEATAAGALLRARGLVPDLVVTSDALRALRTTALLVGDDGWPVRVEPDVYEASPQRLSAVLGRLPDDVGTAVLVCHEPGASGLSVALAGPTADPAVGALRGRLMAGLRTAEAAVLRWDGGWDDLVAATAELVEVLGPDAA